MTLPNIEKGREVRVMKFNGLDIVASILVIIGAINWGLVGLLDVNLVSLIFGSGSTLERIVYVLVGLAGLWSAFSLATKGADISTYQHRRA